MLKNEPLWSILWSPRKNFILKRLTIVLSEFCDNTQDTRLQSIHHLVSAICMDNIFTIKDSAGFKSSANYAIPTGLGHALTLREEEYNHVQNLRHNSGHTNEGGHKANLTDQINLLLEQRRVSSWVFAEIQKGYRVFDLELHSSHVSRDVTFVEHEFPFQFDSSPRALHDLLEPLLTHLSHASTPAPFDIGPGVHVECANEVSTPPSTTTDVSPPSEVPIPVSETTTSTPVMKVISELVRTH
ncbi:hypothetical protein H5410_026862 [Solanum commersonii]|uniref:Retroviral polymerase SH3-like domain-containing protein n=1 Tax=Solanum commersonii TaxID=4109 RepID=A0A9J5YY95_SOLCO|nr:hypothetical protein H5410_026862 [Solanum commersonii]